MSPKIRVTRITIERHEATIIRRHNSETVAYCDHCQERVMRMSRDEAADRLSISTGRIDELASAGQIHFIDGEQAICGGPHKS